MKSLLYLFVLLGTCAALQAADPAGPVVKSATLKKVENLDTTILGASEVYVIEVTFARPVPKASIKHNMFKVQDKDDDSVVTIKSLRQRDLDVVVAGVTNIVALEINGDYN